MKRGSILRRKVAEDLKVVMLAMVVVWGATGIAWADWPRWRGPNGDGHVPTGVVVPKSLSPIPRLVWSKPAGFGSGSPVVSGKTVLYLDNRDGKEVAVALSVADGREIWSVVLDDVLGDSGSPPGPRGTPTVDGDRVYVVSCRGEFRCLRLRDGQQMWRVHFVHDFGAMPIQEAGDIPGAARHGNTASPLVDGNRIYVMVGGRQGASVVCLDKVTGDVIWKSQDDIPGHAGPVMATIGGMRQLVCFTAEGVIGLEPRDGKLLWRVPVKTALGRNVMTPIVVGDTIVVGSYTAGLIGIRVRKGLRGVEAAEAWRDRSLGVNFSCPVEVGGYVYGLGPGNRLFCVEARAGARAWVEEGFFSGMLEQGFASFLVAGQHILILAERGQLLMIAANPSGCRLLARATACGSNWCTPAYTDGLLIVRDRKEVRCLDIAR